MKLLKVTSILCILIILLLGTGCSSINEQSLIDDLTNGGYNVEEYSSSFDVYDIINTYYFTDPYSDDYGYVYELNEDLNEFYENRLEYSYNVNDIVFIYKIDNYVLEIYHGLTSTFPGFIRHYEFEANFQHQLYFTTSLEYHPIIGYQLERGASINEVVEPNDIDVYKEGFTDSCVDVYEIISFTSDGSSLYNYTYVVLITDSIESAEILYDDMDRFVIYGNVLYHYVQYQNLVFRISTDLIIDSETITQYLFDSVVFQVYDSKDRFETE